MFSSDDEKYKQKRDFEKRIGNDHVTFEVYDSVYGFTKKEWSRVVCLFTSGEEFQLKDWPSCGKEEMGDNYGGNKQTAEKEKQIKAVNLFHRVKGFYLHYQDIVEPPVVKTWNVTRFVVHRHKRH